MNIATELRSLLSEYRPDSAAVEEVFFAVNPKSALKLSHVRGVALLAVAEASVMLAEYSPPPLDPAVKEAIDAYVARRVSELG